MTSSPVEAFIAKARKDPELLEQLEGCSIEQWGDQHTPLDVDLDRVVEVAQKAGFQISRADLIAAQCKQLDGFWSFEMNNSFVARRCLETLQCQVSDPAWRVRYY